MARNPEKKRCKARSKQRDEQCKNWAKPGWDVCRFHGAGGGAPERNTNAVKTGEHETIWYDTLDDEERQLFELINLDPLAQANEQIRFLSIRERRMMIRIRKLTEGLTEKQRRVLQKRLPIKTPVEVHEEKTGVSKTVVLTHEELVTAEIEETEYRAIEDIIALEESLTRVQDKKLKAIQLKAQLLSNGGGPEKQITVRRWSRDKSGT
ncbi:Pleiotropic drug resistance protein 3-like [Brevibacillus sp. IT-7CA2]|uniref:hypothetical protein n=1 Tax=Brevibacillus sp. IT-7CA2 TaxID=3026436 RepID=UPI0039E07C0E